MKRYLPFVIIVAVAAGTVTGGALIYRAKRAELGRVLTSVVGSMEGDKKPAHLRGNENGRVTLEEFGDFQCPPCGILATALGRIEHDYGDKLRVVFRQFPLPMHAHAQEAARAAEAAGLQGRFWEMHDLLFQNQVEWSNATNVENIFKVYAQTLGLELDRFERDYASGVVEERIAADHKSGEARGVTSTPTLFINGHNLPPAAGGEAGLRMALDAALSGKPLPSTPTPAPTVTPAP